MGLPRKALSDTNMFRIGSLKIICRSLCAKLRDLLSVVTLQNKFKANYPSSEAHVWLIQSEYDNHKLPTLLKFIWLILPTRTDRMPREFTDEPCLVYYKL